MNFVNAAFFRLQLSGALDKMDEAQMKEIREGIAFCESLAGFQTSGDGVFPLGFCKFFDETVAYGYRDEERAYLAVYNLGGKKKKEIPLSCRARAKVVYPAEGGAAAEVSGDVLSVLFKEETGGLYRGVERRKMKEQMLFGIYHTDCRKDRKKFRELAASDFVNVFLVEGDRKERSFSENFKVLKHYPEKGSSSAFPAWDFR